MTFLIYGGWYILLIRADYTIHSKQNITNISDTAQPLKKVVLCHQNNLTKCVY